MDSRSKPTRRDSVWVTPPAARNRSRNALVSAQKAELERLKAQGLDSEEEELEIALKLQQQLLKLGKQFQEVCACSGCACGACDACGAV